MRPDDACLLDMLLAAREAVDFAAGRTFREFEKDRIAQLAILKAVEIVGEAASRVSADPQRAHSDIPWPKIIGMRNRLVHAYFEVNLERVWDTLQRASPPLFPNSSPSYRRRLGDGPCKHRSPDRRFA